MYACMYAVLQIGVYACNVGMYVRTHVRRYACMYACMYVCMYAYMCVCICVCMHACVHVCMHVCMYDFEGRVGFTQLLLHVHAAQVRSDKPSMPM